LFHDLGSGISFHDALRENGHSTPKRMTGAQRQQGAEQMNWRAIAFIVLIVICGNSVPSNAAEISCAGLFKGEIKSPLAEVQTTNDGAAR
jgi:hypothetical protein